MTSFDARSSVRIWSGADPVVGFDWLLSGEAPRGLVLLPSSLRRRDALVAMLRSHLRGMGGSSQVEAPVGAVASLANLGGRPDQWAEREIAPPDATRRKVRLPAGVVNASQIWSATDVDAVSGRGPYVLDLMARYLDPVSRIKQAAASGRSGAVEVNLARRIDRCILSKRIEGQWMSVSTTDLIAAELMALALVDVDLAGRHRVAGPWEDALVQRATELELGARLPAEIRVDVAADMPSAANETLLRVLERIGIRRK